jgi:aromatic-amino-acid transaminase
MPNETKAEHDLFGSLTLQPPDALLALIGAFGADQRPDKIDLGVGVYRDAVGRTPVLSSVKEAERRLLESQATKSYLGPEGDTGFFEALKPIVFGPQNYDKRLCGLQTPGGTGALRLAAELIARASPHARVWLGKPTWPNHRLILEAVGLEIVDYDHFDLATQQLAFDSVLEAFGGAEPGDVALLQGCCHNPTGADFDADQWKQIACLLRERRVIPLVDLAYQGLGDGLHEDASGTRIVLDVVGRGLVAYSCDKNFGLYRERVGALFAVSESAKQRDVLQSNLLLLSRVGWSMPPDHGAAIVRVILEDEALTADWRAELDGMRLRTGQIRTMLAQAEVALAPLAFQRGMFAMLPLGTADVARLREERGIYMPASGRINIAGLTPATVPLLIDALASLRRS